MPKTDEPLTIVINAVPTVAPFHEGHITVRLSVADDYFSTLRLIDGAGHIHDWIISCTNLVLLKDEIRNHLIDRARTQVRPPRNYAATGRHGARSASGESKLPALEAAAAARRGT